MIPRTWVSGEVAVLGFARTGQSTARFLASRGVRVYASDSADSPAMRSAAASIPNLEAQFGAHDLARIAACSLVVPSPGIPPDAPPLRAARKAGVTVVAEVELAWRALEDVPFTVITGTNGKSTVTALVGWMHEIAGSSYFVGGNIGRPVIEAAMQEPKPQSAVVEASSFQLHDCDALAPAVGVLTNLAPDHQDRYRSVQDYYDDKKRLFRNSTFGSKWILNADNAEVLELAEDARGKKYKFSTKGPADGWYDTDTARLMLGDEVLLERRELRIIGMHNVANVLAAALAARSMGLGLDDLRAACRTFGGLPNRLELVGELDGVSWINDSKATNVDATATAIEAMDRDFVLLLGGRHKGNAYTPLAPLLASHCRGVVAYGEAGPLIASDLASRVRVTPAPGDFNSVLDRARQLAREGDCVLLSPACSSFDMFTDYEDRGRQFRDYVRNGQRKT